MYLDHIVHSVMKKPQEVAKVWTDKGIHAVVGGQHTNWGTYNALLYTKTSYVEWLAVEHEEVAKKANHPLIDLMIHDLDTSGAGFSTICIRTTEIDGLNLQLQEQGIKTSGVLHAERKTVSGFVRKWKMLFVTEEISDSLPSPFFIEWEESDEEKYRLLEEDGTIEKSNLELSITVCEFHVRNPREVMDKWKNYFQLVEQDEQTLLLENTRLVFKPSNNTKERLASIEIAGAKKQEEIIYEQATYRFL
ncbi:Glyoxalase-like domain-containing protein [Psychrobacillus sp. OK028]|uniref:VOC family protein n=1 Tax=Psychrobacillus sp. OK028 TaxID=1884359 RepID=UPI00088590EC|nr:VOC family protein [Psychrobacillus sp. OK028]SDN42109.1 Glyoxalase-like domain-containing protein [Psychrobacillus sp. OK028]